RSADAASVVSRGLLLVLGGMLAYGAYNTRTIFLFPMILSAFALPTAVYRKHNARIRVVAIALFLIGMAISSAPQGFINLKNRGVFWPGVINENLFAKQLFWGITVQRYETSIERSSPSPRLFYIDRAGKQLFQENNVGERPLNIPTYLIL